MITIVLCTKNPMDYNKVLQLLKNNYKSISGNENQVSFGKYPNSCYISLPSKNMNDPIEKEEMEEDLPFIPFDNPYFTHIDFHQIVVIKKVVELLLQEYPELFIIDENDTRYSANEFISKPIIIENGTIKKDQ